MAEIYKILKLLNEKYKINPKQAAEIKNSKEIIILSQRLNLINEKQTAKDLEKKIPSKYYSLVNNLFPRYIKDICGIKKPKCGECFLLEFCEALGTKYNYHKRFNCTHCGYCCTLILKLSKRDIERIEAVGYKKEDFLEPYSDNVKLVDDKCYFLCKDGSKYACRIYDSRPNICRIYPSYNPEMKDCREHRRLRLLHKLP